MNYPDSVRFLYALGNEQKTAKYDLGRIAALLAEMGDPHRRPRRFVHVAGTNGKGSTCATIESGLRAAGWRTGLFTSPHLLQPTERICIDGEPVSVSEFTAAFDTVHELAERLLAAGTIDQHPSYFETVMAMAFLLFRERDAQITVLEVGLGGRLDATNVVEPELCVITPVDFDHEKILGTSIEAIASEKAGILKPGIPAVVAPQRPEADRVIRERAAELSVPVCDAEKADGVTVDREGSTIQAGGSCMRSPLRGRHQVVNTLTAITALRQMGIAPDAIAKGVETVVWPGRLQKIGEHPEVIVDGAHNPAGARALASYVGEFYRDSKAVLIFGAMRDKAVEEMAATLFPLFREVIVTAPDQPRALAPETLLHVADHACVRTARDLASALAMITEPDSSVFVSGSLFLVSEAMRLVR